MKVRAFGLDLAWKDRNATGAVVVDEGGRVLSERLLLSDDDIVTWVLDHVVGDATTAIAIDGPLIVPNPTGRRSCESELSAEYAARKAATHSSNRTLFSRWYGRVRGEDLVERFAAHGFELLARQAGIIEVYPHPALIELFGLAERHRYKAKRGFRVADRRIGLQELDTMLASLGSADPPLLAPPLVIDNSVRGRALKDAEDLLDARLCAWLALLWVEKGPDGFTIYGDRESGHIAVPRGPALSRRS